MLTVTCNIPSHQSTPRLMLENIPCFAAAGVHCRGTWLSTASCIADICNSMECMDAETSIGR